jgi:hypothetical protein
MKTALKSCLVIVLVLMGLCIASVAGMYFTGICPPAGPWPLPPWCSSDPETEAPASIQEILENGECPPVGPWPMPPWCENPETLAGEGENITVTFWVTISHTMQVDDVTLSITGQEPVTMEKTGPLSYQTQVSLPGQSSVDYTYLLDNAELETRYNAQITQKRQAIYDAVPFNAGYQPVKAVFMMDTWGRNYNFTWGEDTGKNIESSFERVAALGAQEVYVADFYRAVYDSGSFELDNLDYHIEEDIFENDQRDQAMTTEELQQLAEAAHAQGLKIAWSSNFTFVNFGDYIGKDIITLDTQDKAKVRAPKSEEWVVDFLSKWRALMLDRAAAIEAAGFDIMIISPGYHDPTYAPHDAIADEMWIETIHEIRKVFSGEIGYIVEGHTNWISANDQTSWLSDHDFYNELDIQMMYMLDFSQEWISEYKPADNSFEDLRTAMDRYMDDIENGAEKLEQRPSILFGCYSMTDSFTLGGYETRGIDIQEAIVHLRDGTLVPDYQYQAECYEAMLQASADRQVIERVILKGYWWDDAMDPDTAMFAISISETIRNKAAEAVVRKWWLE